MLKLEQKTESLHHDLNVLENRNCNIKDTGERLLTSIRLYENANNETYKI